MKKVLKIGPLADLSKSAFLLAYRTAEAFKLQGLEFEPTSRFKLEKVGSELIIRVQMNEGEFLAIDDGAGIAEKFEV